MSAPNMATITDSLERSFQNCSLSHRKRSTNSGGALGAGLGFRQTTFSSSDSPENHHHHHLSDATLDLNSQISLPYYWERCLDLKSGEIYYINWRTGMKATEDPRTSADFYSEEEEEEDDDGDDEDDDDSTSSYEDSEEEYSSERVPAAAASSSSSTSSKRDEQYHYHHHQQTDHERDEKHVLVVAGCKGCLMYFMVPKQVEDCPKCTAQLLHFDR